MPMIIQTTCGRFYQVRDAGPGLEHVWLGQEMKPVKRGKLDCGFLPKGKAEILVRRAAANVVKGGA